ncbi:MAG: hypothetical protein AB1657_02995 [Candidatus Micrarchaeota archaeon]
MHTDSSPVPAAPVKRPLNETVRGIAIEPAAAGLERAGITKAAALTMLRRMQQEQLHTIGRGASKSLFEIVNDTSLDKADRKSAAGTLLWIMESDMPAEDVAACLLAVGYPRDREIAGLGSPKVGTVLKNVLLNESEETEFRARAAIALKDRKFAGFERREDDAAYRFFVRDYTNLVKCGAAAVPFLLGRLKDQSVPADQETAAMLLGEISVTYNEEEHCDWRKVVGTMRELAKEPDPNNPLTRDTEEKKHLRGVLYRAYRMITGEYPKY